MNSPGLKYADRQQGMRHSGCGTVVDSESKCVYASVIVHTANGPDEPSLPPKRKNLFAFARLIVTKMLLNNGHRRRPEPGRQATACICPSEN